jgi:hypothetical protein
MYGRACAAFSDEKTAERGRVGPFKRQIVEYLFEGLLEYLTFMLLI